MIVIQLSPTKLLMLSLLCAFPSFVHCATKYYDFKVAYGLRSPDFQERPVLTINGEFPGPAIHVTSGERLQVRVKNGLFTEGIVIHWHGLRQRGTPWADGAAYVTQCPILPGETYTYSFETEQPGTFFYHGHNGMQQGEGLYGALIVHPRKGAEDPFKYDGELNILLGDWYHRSALEQELGLHDRKFRWVGNPQSLLINGRGRYNRSFVQTDAAAVNGNTSLVDPTVLRVQHGKTYRLRISSAAALATLNFSIQNHNFTIVEVDGHYVEPLAASSLHIFSGQSYSVLLNANQDPSRNYWVLSSMRERSSNVPPGLAILAYIPDPPLLLPTIPLPAESPWDHHEDNLKQHKSYVALKGTEMPLPLVINRRLILLSSQGLSEAGVLKWAINNISYELPETPLLAIMKYNLTEDLSTSHLPLDEYHPRSDIFSNTSVQLGSRAYIFQPNDVVDVILQNSNSPATNVSEVHPWHMHGHDFWVLGFGKGVFDPSKDYEGLNYENPPLRHTVPLFPYGWTAIRFVSDNYGVWNFHCHLQAHHSMGMAVTFAAGVDHIPDIPKQALGCGRTKQLQFLASSSNPHD